MTWRSDVLLAMLLAIAAAACGNRETDIGAVRSSDASLVVVTLDTTRADRLGVYGGPAEVTPNLDALARAGAVFEHVFAVAPTTLPAHATLFTGTDPTRHGVRHNGVHHLAEDATTLAEVLQREGFATAAFVSSAVLERRYGLAQGFAVYDDECRAPRRELGRFAERQAADTVDRALAWLDGVVGTEDGAAVGTEDGAADGAPAGSRFFLWVHLYDPHAVYAPPEPYASTWKSDPYTGEVAYLDAQLGRLFAHPRLGPGTLITAIGDHGESLGEHGEANHGMLLYDGALRVPWIVRGPGVVAGRRIGEPAAQVDLLPTLLDLLGIEPTSGASRSSISADDRDRGRSWASALAGEDSSARGVSTAPADDSAARVLYSETLAPFLSYGWAPLHAVRRGAWKLIGGPSPELYDTESDPSESRNVIAAEKAIARDLGRVLESIAAADKGVAEPAPLDAAEAEKLRSLGYLTTAHPRRPSEELPDPKTMIDLHRRLGEAQQSLHDGDLETAAAKLAVVTSEDPGNVTALEAQATALTRLGRFAEAESTLDRALVLDPRRPSLLLAAAGLRAQAGKLEDALALSQQAAKLGPLSIEAEVAVARYQAALGQNEAAAESARRALALAPSTAAAEVIYADLVERPSGALDSAERRLRGVVDREPLLPEGWLALGSVLQERGDRAGAVDAYVRGLEAQPASGQLHAALGVLLAEQGTDGAERHLQRAAELLRPAPASVHRGLALAAIRRRSWSEAERAVRAALELDARDASAWTLLAAIREENGSSTGALDAYQRALDSDPRNTAARFNRALLFRRLSRFTESAADLDAVLSIDPGNAKAHYELGILNGGPLGDPRAARDHFERALAAGHPDTATIRRALDELGARPDAN